MSPAVLEKLVRKHVVQRGLRMGGGLCPESAITKWKHSDCTCKQCSDIGCVKIVSLFMGCQCQQKLIKSHLLSLEMVLNCTCLLEQRPHFTCILLLMSDFQTGGKPESQVLSRTTQTRLQSESKKKQTTKALSVLRKKVGFHCRHYF